MALDIRRLDSKIQNLGVDLHKIKRVILIFSVFTMYSCAVFDNYIEKGSTYEEKAARAVKVSWGVGIAGLTLPWIPTLGGGALAINADSGHPENIALGITLLAVGIGLITGALVKSDSFSADAKGFRLAAAMDSWVGSPIDDLFSSWGAPNYSTGRSDGGGTFTWTRYQCKQSFSSDKQGIIFTWSFSGC